MTRAILTVGDLSKLLQLHEDTVRRLLRDGQLPGRKIGKSWRVEREALFASWRRSAHTNQKTSSSSKVRVKQHKKRRNRSGGDDLVSMGRRPKTPTKKPTVHRVLTDLNCIGEGE